MQGYPTLKWFVNGKESDYKGGRTASEIENWIAKKTGPAVAAVSAERLEELKNKEKVFYVQVGAASAETEQLAQGLDDLVVVSVESLEGYAQGDLVAFRKFDEPQVKCEECATAAEMQSFVDATRVARVMEFDQEAAQHIFGNQKSAMILFVDETAHEAQKAMLNEASDKLIADGLVCSFSQIKKDIGQRLAEYVGVKEDMLPLVQVIDFQGDDLAKYTMDKEVSVENMVEFAQQWKNKELKRQYKSAAEPEQSHENNVRILVGTNFEAEVLQVEGRHTLVEFYAPWCGHCKKLTPEYEALATKLKGFDKIVIAKVDSTENEVPNVAVQGFPTIKFFADNKVVDYDAGRTAKDMEAWLVEKVEGLKEFLAKETAQDAPQDAEKAEEATKEDL